MRNSHRSTSSHDPKIPSIGILPDTGCADPQGEVTCIPEAWGLVPVHQYCKGREEGSWRLTREEQSHCNQA